MIRYVLLILLLTLFGCSGNSPYAEAPVSGNTVTIDLAALSLDEPVFYSYKHNEREIRFFIVRIDGSPVAFLDACETCYSKNLGYRWEDGRLVCRACNMSFTLKKIEKGIGGCTPVRLSGSLVDGKFTIQLKTLQEGLWMF